MRILQMVQRPQRRGAELFAFDLSRSLQAREHEVKTLYLYGFDGEGGLSVENGDSRLEGTDDHPFERFPGFHPGMLHSVLREIRDYRPDIVQVNGSRTVKYGAAARFLARDRRGWKLVYRNIGIPSDWHSWGGSVWAYRNLIMPQMDGVVGVSRFSLDDAQALYGIRAPATVILNGISPTRLKVIEERNEIRDRYGASSESPILLYVGHMEGAKRPDRFVRVVAEVARAMPDVRGWVLGDGPLRRDTERLSRDLGVGDRIHFFGSRDDVASFMNASDLLLVTSDTEGVPATVLESGYLGLPVVATRVGGLSECVIEGETGVLVDGEKRLVQTAIELCSNEPLRRSLGQKARAWVESELTIDRIADQYLAFYDDLLDHGAACHASSI